MRLCLASSRRNCNRRGKNNRSTIPMRGVTFATAHCLAAMAGANYAGHPNMTAQSCMLITSNLGLSFPIWNWLWIISKCCALTATLESPTAASAIGEGAPDDLPPGFRLVSGKRGPKDGTWFIKLRMGFWSEQYSYTPEQLRWKHDGSAGDIVAVKRAG